MFLQKNNSVDVSSNHDSHCDTHADSPLITLRATRGCGKVVIYPSERAAVRMCERDASRRELGAVKCDVGAGAKNNRDK